MESNLIKIPIAITKTTLKHTMISILYCNAQYLVTSRHGLLNTQNRVNYS